MAPHRTRLWSAGAKWVGRNGHLIDEEHGGRGGGTSGEKQESFADLGPAACAASAGRDPVREELARRPHTADGLRSRRQRPRSGYRRVFLGSLEPQESLADGDWMDSRFAPQLTLQSAEESSWLSPAASPPSSYAGSTLSDDSKGEVEDTRSTDSIVSAVGFGLTIPQHAEQLRQAVAAQPVGHDPVGDPNAGQFIRLATSAEHASEREFAAAARAILGDDEPSASDGGSAATSDRRSAASNMSRSRPASAVPERSVGFRARPASAPAVAVRVENISSDPPLLYARRSQALCEIMAEEPNEKLQIAPRLASERTRPGSGLDARLGSRLDHLQAYLRESEAIREQFAGKPRVVDENVTGTDSMRANADDTDTDSQLHGAPFTHIRRRVAPPPLPAEALGWTRGSGGPLLWAGYARSETSAISLQPEEPLVVVEMEVRKTGPDPREGYVEFNFNITCHQLGSEFWGSETDLGSCLDVLENENSSTEQWWHKRNAQRLAKEDTRGPEFAALTAFRECDFAPVSMFFKMLNERRSVVNLSHYHLGPRGAMAIARSVDSSQDIGTLVLADCGLLDEGVAAMASAMRRNNSVVILDLSGNPFGEPAMREMAEAMLMNSSLVTLRLRDCKLGCVEMELLSKSLYDNTTVRTLDLRYNEIGARGALSLARMLELNNYIHHLHLDWNQVQLGGCRALATALTKNLSLETLSLSHNALHNYGAIKLSEALIANCTLRTLDLSSNSIGVEGCYAISHGMTRNQGITALDISGNTVGQDGGKRLWDSVLRHPALCSLGLDHVGPHVIHNHQAFPLAMQAFSPDVCPTGHWALDLTCEWHRWLVRKMVERCTKDEFKKIEKMQNMKLNGRPMSGGKKSKKGPAIDPDALPQQGLLRFDYMLERKQPAYERKCVFDLRSAKQAKIAKECYHRAVTMPHELWKDISISGQQRNFSKDGSMQFPKKGVLSFTYVIQEIDIDLENLDGSHQLTVEWPWHMYAAEQILEKVLADEGVVTDCKWENMHYHLSKTQDNIPEVGLLELTYTSIIYRPQHEVYYQLNMACDTERWVAAQLRARADEDHSPVTAPERSGSFIGAVMYSENEPVAGEAAWEDWMEKWSRLPVQSSGIARGRTGEEGQFKLRNQLSPDDGRQVVDRGTDHYPLSMRASWMHADKGRPSYKHEEFEYFLPKKGVLMVKFVVKSSRSVEAESHVVDLSNAEERNKAVKLYSEATRSMYASWTRIKLEKPSATGSPIKKALEFAELMRTPGGWRIPHEGLLQFDHVLCKPVPDGCPDHIGIVRFHMLKQQVIRNINNGMPLQAVTDAMQYLNLAKVSAAKFSTEQLFILLALIPAARRNELVRLLYPSVTDFHNLFNLLLTDPVKKHCIPQQVGDIVDVETAHTHGGRRSRWQAISTFLAHGLQEYRRRPGTECDRRPEFHKHPRLVGKTAQKTMVAKATIHEPSTQDIKLMYQDEQRLQDDEQAKLDKQLQRTRRMSTDMDTRIELGGNGVAAVKKLDALAHDMAKRQRESASLISNVEPAEDTTDASKGDAKGTGKGKGKGKGKKKKKERPPPPPNKLEVAAADTKKILAEKTAADNRKVTPFLMQTARVHSKLDEFGKARLLQRRQLGGTSNAARRQTGWTGFGRARPVGSAQVELQEKFYLGQKMKTTTVPMQSDPVGAQSAIDTPALALRNEVARRQRVRARLAMLKRSGSRPQ